jgi:uncharacterized protein (TIGR00661 family)
MKILYGVQATGNGHISRSRIMAQYLKEKNADVTYLFSGRDKDKLFAMEDFGDYKHRRGLTFAIENGRINQLKTVTQNNLFIFMQDIKNLSLDEYDLVITDFEPVTAWAAKLQNKPSIGIGHQYSFGADTPIVDNNLMGKQILKYFAPVKYSAGLHWHPFDESIFPPIIDLQLKRVESDNTYIVYLPFENQIGVSKILNKLKGYQFIQYSPDLIDGQYGDNIRLRKTSLHGFKRDLCKAKGVICNAGFELISECLHLGLPILAKPLTGQIEQNSNALALTQLGYADIQEKIDFKGIQDWLVKDKVMTPRPLPNVAKSLTEWVLSGEWQNYTALRNELWGNIQTV